MTVSITETLQVIDSDTHVAESPDLWTSRLPAKWQDLSPRVDNGRWHVGDEWLSPVAAHAHAGWREFPPASPPSLDDADPASYDPKARLERMDERGIYAEVLYPNLLGFEPFTFMAHENKAFALACVSIYNDFTTEFASVAPDRFIPITVVPFWDLKASVEEIRRCTAMGQRGILFANKYERAGLPSFTDRHWDPIYAVAQEMGISINFHVAFGSRTKTGEGAEHTKKIREMVDRGKQGGTKQDPPDRALVVDMVRLLSASLLGNAPTIVNLLTSDVCERFPSLKFVSVESGFGYVPYLLEGLDWNWLNMGGRDAFKERLLPSEYFLRQCYGTFWFEKGTLALLEQYPNNFMFETDFPHPVGINPGPASYAELPRIHIAKQMDGLSESVIRKALHENAANVYNIR